MKRKLFTKIGLALTALAIGVIAPMAATAGWSPAREIKTYNGPGTAGFDHVTFNSFTNVPDFGDERGFFTAKDAANTASGGWTDTIKVQPGQEILLQTYVHNGADPSLNTAAGQPGIARNTKVKVYLPTASEAGLRANSYVSASNATPGTVTDTADIQSANGAPVSLSYVPGSAKAYTNAVPAGMPIADSIVGDGALVGYNQPDGNIPGCFEYIALVTIKVKVNGPSLSLIKKIAHPGQPWTEEVTSKPGETLSYLLTYQNNGTGVAHHVTVRDQLPQHVEFVPGSAKIITDSTGPDGEQLSDTALFTTGGIDTSDYGPGAGGHIKFQVKLKDDFAPGRTRVKNVAYAHDLEMPDEINDDAYFNVEKETPPPTPTPECKPGIPVGDARCEGVPPVIPPTTPQTPSMPATGPEAGLAGLLGSTGLTFGALKYRKSKKAVAAALRKVK